MKPATIKKHAERWVAHHCVVYEFAKRTYRRNGTGALFTFAEDLYHGCFDAVGFDGRKWRLIQWTSPAGVSARRSKIEQQFMARLNPRDADERSALAATTTVELWAYVGRRVFQVWEWSWDRWTWSERRERLIAPAAPRRNA